MSRETYRLRRARKQRRCSECHGTIQPGDRYLDARRPPENDANSSDCWWIMGACLDCIDEYGLHNSDTRAQLAEVAS